MNEINVGKILSSKNKIKRKTVCPQKKKFLESKWKNYYLRTNDKQLKDRERRNTEKNGKKKGSDLKKYRQRSALETRSPFSNGGEERGEKSVVVGVD